jgi:sulfoxide reductase catalytic subunit YedY
MLIRVKPPFAIAPSEITPEAVYHARRRLLAQIGWSAFGLACAACGHADPAPAKDTDSRAGAARDDAQTLAIASRADRAGGEAVTPMDSVTHYNNFYEYGTDKADPAANAWRLRTRPWTVRVEGQCEAPGVIGIDELLKLYPLEERIYRHRCVEAWSIVVPWDGFALGPFLKRFKPTSRAKYVAFYSLYDPEQMPQAGNTLPWPYREGLRIEEAMHPLAFLSVGMYGKTMPKQDGAPLRLTIPWKYGFKSIKSIVKIEFTELMPPTTWNVVASDEYGFYSNVNPNVDHPRWSQKTERRLGELFRRPTLMFNGYPEVAPLYAGLDLRTYF